MVLEEGDKNGDYRQAREGTNKPVNTSVSSFSTQTVSNCLLLDNDTQWRKRTSQMSHSSQDFTLLYLSTNRTMYRGSFNRCLFQ